MKAAKSDYGACSQSFWRDPGVSVSFRTEAGESGPNEPVSSAAGLSQSPAYAGSAVLLVSQVGISVGTVLQSHAAAGPTVMLAMSDELRARSIRGQLLTFTDRTLTDPADLTRHLDRSREIGYSVSDSDYLDGWQ